MTVPWDIPSGTFLQALAEQLTSKWMLASLAVGAYMVSFAVSRVFGYKVPVYGVSSQFEPTMVSNFRFFRRAENVLNEGYQAVSRPVKYKMAVK